MKTKIKICGVKTHDTANYLVKMQADFIGFIFYEKSPRNISLENYADISKAISGKIKIVAVVVNADDNFIQNLITHHKPDYIQLHGSESPQRVQQIKDKFNINIIKAISVSSKDDIEKAGIYKDVADYILFDAKPPKNSDLPGGNAVSFNWDYLQDFNPDYNWVLSGGINVQNVNKALNSTESNFIDISSGVESSSGIKDNSLIQAIFQKVKEN